MTITARIVKAVVTLPILGTVSRNDKGEVVKSGEQYRIHIYAAKPGMKYESQTHTHLLVGVMDGAGYTSESVKRSDEVLLPDGRELIALRVDDFGVPLSWESLPVEVSAASYSVGPFVVKNGQVFINDAAIGETAQVSAYEGSFGIKTEAGPEIVDRLMREFFESDEADRIYSNLESLDAISKLPEVLSEFVKSVLKRELQPGGLLHGR